MLVVFGGGYGFSGLVEAGWVRDCDVVYGGDLDIYDFAIETSCLSTIRTFAASRWTKKLSRTTALSAVLRAGTESGVTEWASDVWRMRRTG